MSDQNLFLPNLLLPWHSHIAPALVAVVIIATYVLVPADVARAWALSHVSVQQTWWTLILHMFVHGSVAHLLLNAAALLFVAPRFIATVGSAPISWARFFYIFIGSGIAGGATFLLLNNHSLVSVLGASGAIFGIIGALARVHPKTGEAVPLFSRRSWLLARVFARDHAIIFILILGALILTGQSAAVAWEAHLGGMLFGLIAAPLFLARSSIER